MTNIALIFCPCCGSATAPDFYVAGKQCAAHCSAESGGCGLSTAWKDTREEAATAWNARAEGEHDVEAKPAPAASATHPAHYARLPKGYEPADVAEKWGFGRDFYLGNILKYVARCDAGSPAEAVEDMRKAESYCRRVWQLIARTSPGSVPGEVKAAAAIQAPDANDELGDLPNDAALMRRGATWLRVMADASTDDEHRALGGNMASWLERRADVLDRAPAAAEPALPGEAVAPLDREALGRVAFEAAQKSAQRQWRQAPYDAHTHMWQQTFCDIAEAVANAVRSQPVPVCATCGKPATCFGKYEGHTEYSCDDCCGHGCEDGHCDKLAQPVPTLAQQHPADDHLGPVTDAEWHALYEEFESQREDEGEVEALRRCDVDELLAARREQARKPVTPVFHVAGPAEHAANAKADAAMRELVPVAQPVELAPGDAALLAEGRRVFARLKAAVFAADVVQYAVALGKELDDAKACFTAFWRRGSDRLLTLAESAVQAIAERDELRLHLATADKRVSEMIESVSKAERSSAGANNAMIDSVKMALAEGERADRIAAAARKVVEAFDASDERDRDDDVADAIQPLRDALAADGEAARKDGGA